MKKNDFNMPSWELEYRVSFWENQLIWDTCWNCSLLRTARSFYGSLWYLLTYLRTYVRTYVQVIFRRSHPTLKLIKQKMSEIIQVNVPNFFYFAEIQKMTKLGPKNRFWDPKIKINPSVSNPTINPLFFEIQTWNFTWWFIATFWTLFDLIMYSLKVFLQVRLNLQSSTKVSNL